MMGNGDLDIYDSPIACRPEEKKVRCGTLVHLFGDNHSFN